MFPPTLMGALGLMNEQCSECGLVFLREAGYFLGAMYVSYGLGVLTILPVGVILAVWAGWHLGAVFAVVILMSVVCMPLFLRYSRIIWLHLDQRIDPR
jgi:MFS family permease